MESFKQFLKSKKAIVYHVSPNSSIKKLRPTGSHKGQQSIKMGRGGIYVAPKFKDAVAWATSYVGGKKYHTQKPNDRLKERESGGGWHGDKGPKNYKNLTIYELEVPEELLKNSWSNSFWEPEYFISAEYMNHIKVIKSTTYSLDELMVLDRVNSQKRMELISSKELIEIKRASKTNQAARYYLELLDSYNQHLLKGKNPIINQDSDIKNDHVIRQKTEKLKDYIFYSDNNWTSLKIIEKLNKDQKREAEQIYQDVKKLIQSL